MSAEQAKGRFDWYDLMTEDTEGAKAFYTQVIGWTTAPWGGPGGDSGYTMWLAGEEGVGGVVKLPDEAKAMGAPSHWLGYVVVPDVDATAKAFADAGGRVLRPAYDMAGVGRIAVVADPWGASIGLFLPGGELDGEVPKAGPGEVSWCELATENWEAAHAFYKTVFGWIDSDKMDMGEQGGMYQMFKKQGMEWSIGGIFNRPKEMPVSAWLYYFRVEDLDGAMNRVRELGGKVVNGPMEVPGGDHVAQCADPQGGMFAMHARKQG
jgi:uncharacterized protein